MPSEAAQTGDRRLSASIRPPPAALRSVNLVPLESRMTYAHIPSRLSARRTATVATLMLGVSLAGCAGVGDSFMSGAFVDPAKYDQYDCKQLEGERKSLEFRTAELQGLIDKANRGAAGAVVGEAVYRNDYISARASAKLAEEVWVKNKCVASPTPVAPPPPAAPAKKPHQKH